MTLLHSTPNTAWNKLKNNNGDLMYRVYDFRSTDRPSEIYDHEIIYLRKRNFGSHKTFRKIATIK